MVLFLFTDSSPDYGSCSASLQFTKVLLDPIHCDCCVCEGLDVHSVLGLCWVLCQMLNVAEDQFDPAEVFSSSVMTSLKSSLLN